ncbi:uncharacterized protein LOC120901507 isoform X1 [Anopheles arabiensis]|uniref:uncharacterized protein LOC120901507 isoform X1 n=1 Tax=Anopheles arabiensis TaxID=7173 RepID=UPI001AACAB10|nr:uncharacterized protein LOC120901507 isoform X1 [Anopheles arabiensis]
MASTTSVRSFSGQEWFATVFLLIVLSSSGVQCFERFSPINELLLSEFEYDTNIDRDLLPLDERSYFSYDEPHEPTFHTDYNLANLKPISPTPGFTLDPSYISPEDIVPARAKRANLRERRKPSTHRKREQEKELLTDEHEEDLDEDDADEKASESEERTDVDDYAARYEQFIAKHFEDLESKRKKSAPQRKAPKPTDKEDDDDGEEEEEQDGDYRFDRGDYSSSEDYERIKAESEEQSRRLAKDPRNCRTYEKDGMVCSVCHDPASDSASESCAYATEPHHRKYAYVKERNYDSKKDADPNRAKAEVDEEEEEDGDEEPEHSGAETRPERQTDGAGDGIVGSAVPTTPSRRRLPAHPLRKPTLRSKPHHSATNGGGYRYQPTDLRSNRASMKLKLAEGSGPAADDANIYVMNYDNEPEEVAKVLAEFKARDWSNCRTGKRMEDGELTCYQCTDAAGVNHEECMYVSESRPIASEPVRPPPSMTGKLQLQRQAHKRKKVVALSRKELAALEPSATSAAGGGPVKEKQTVKRTVSFRSFITGSGRGAPGSSSSAYVAHAGSDGDERVIHYEHHISHEVP